MTDRTTNAFAKNRAEELGFDLWNEFVVPPYYNQLSLEEIRKPLLIEGGRGCGKTSLLRFLSHRTQFSEKRVLRADSLPMQIGLYLRADTQFLRTFRGASQTDDQWHRVFEHFLCLIILREMLSALDLLGRGPDRREIFGDMHALQFECLQDFEPSAPIEFESVFRWLSRQHNRLAVWLQNSETADRPRLLPLKHVLLACITAIQEQIPHLVDRVFFIFIDEYENLLPYQMKLINTFLKHSEPPLMFHIAVKRNAMSDRSTMGNEQLQEPDDFRTFNIEDRLAPDFELFAAELFCFRLLRKKVRLEELPVTADDLRDPSHVERRFTERTYRDAILKLVDSYLPSVSHEDVAQFVFDDDTLRQQLSKELRKALDIADRAFSPEQFMRPEFPRASVCSLALLNQGKRPQEILDELAKLKAGAPSKFETAEWTHHYFLGTALYLHLSLQRPCLAYAGFDSFVKMSRNNIRHFLELCHLSMQAQDGEGPRSKVEGWRSQANAARSASMLFVKETQGSGDYGNRLFLIVNTLGQLFRMSQQRPSQSEFERTHFSVVKGALSEQSQEILRECVKWSVLIATRETKVKDPRLETDEYIFNPIYAPFFGISYNKGRRLEIPVEHAEALFAGDRRGLDETVKHFKRQWGLTESDQLPLL